MFAFDLLLFLGFRPLSAW